VLVQVKIIFVTFRSSI